MTNIVSWQIDTMKNNAYRVTNSNDKNDAFMTVNVKPAALINN